MRTHRPRWYICRDSVVKRCGLPRITIKARSVPLIVPLRGPEELMGNPLRGPEELMGNPLRGPEELMGNPLRGPEELMGNPLRGGRF